MGEVIENVDFGVALNVLCGSVLLNHLKSGLVVGIADSTASLLSLEIGSINLNDAGQNVLTISNIMKHMMFV